MDSLPWLPSGPNLKPQRAHQLALGYFKNLQENSVETSVEAYYKSMDNQIDFKDHAQILLNPRIEGEMRVGKGKAYGLEFLVRKNNGKLTGWASYTLSRVTREISGINDGNPYPARYDRTHDISLVLNYDPGKRWSCSANWVYATGAAVTMPSGRFEYRGSILPVYTDRNASRLPAYHRFDLSATLESKHKENAKWKGSWVFSIYNAYYRKNTYLIKFDQKLNDPTTTEATKLYLFSIVPAVTYNFKF